ncbi:hypothetical protein [Cohnella abietis]|uniref:Endolytic transglycosylase MltG n=1 Tax=Cohnella abietis TaxID=2507935 RepID=A0A3T1D8K5_9BACL|nr:hypothetical protein [Cohnella abietis]BBI34409.1 hypothetical protein KCTCHS21_38080 [Cohnella abietis]
MRKYRSLLMGLGMGLVLGASMLQFILFAQEQSGKLTDETLTQEQLSKEAQKSGYVIVPANEVTYTQKQLETKIDEAVATALANQSTIKDEAVKEESKPAEQNKEGSELPAANTSDLEASEAVTLYVRHMMTLTEVAKELVKLGVIDDTDGFINKARPISKKMNIGTAVFTGKPTYEQIMTELTRKKEY